MNYISQYITFFKHHAIHGSIHRIALSSCFRYRLSIYTLFLRSFLFLSDQSIFINLVCNFSYTFSNLHYTPYIRKIALLFFFYFIQKSLITLLLLHNYYKQVFMHFSPSNFHFNMNLWIWFEYFSFFIFFHFRIILIINFHSMIVHHIIFLYIFLFSSFLLMYISSLHLSFLILLYLNVSFPCFSR